MVDVTEDARVKAAKGALRDAKIAALKDHFRAERVKNGDCPREYMHFSFSSFWVGVMLGSWATFMVVHIVETLTK